MCFSIQCFIDQSNIACIENYTFIGNYIYRKLYLSNICSIYNKGIKTINFVKFSTVSTCFFIKNIFQMEQNKYTYLCKVYNTKLCKLYISIYNLLIFYTNKNMLLNQHYRAKSIQII